MADDVVTDLGKALAAWPGLLVKKAMMLADARDTVCMLNAARQKYDLFSLQSRSVVLYSTSGCNLHPNWLLHVQSTIPGTARDTNVSKDPTKRTLRCTTHFTGLGAPEVAARDSWLHRLQSVHILYSTVLYFIFRARISHLQQWLTDEYTFRAKMIHHG